MSKTTISPLKALQNMTQYLLCERLKILNIADEINSIEQRWATQRNQDFMINNQVSLLIYYGSDLAESWILAEIHKESVPTFSLQAFDELMAEMSNLIRRVQLMGLRAQHLTHVLYVNQIHEINWIQHEGLQIQQIEKIDKNHSLHLSLAYLPAKFYELAKSSIMSGRQRFSSFNDLPSSQRNPRRKTSHDIENNKRPNEKPIKGSKDQKTQQSRMVSIYSKKDDVEILSNPEDYDKIMTDNKDDDFEIQMIIVEVDLKQLLIEQKKKLTRSSTQIAKIFDFISYF